MEIKKPEVINNTFVSDSPAVKISVDPRFEYLGQVEISRYPTTSDGYVFGIVKDNYVEKAVMMLYTSLTSGEHVWEHGAPPGYQHVEKGGYDWYDVYNLFTSADISKYWKTKFINGVLLKEAYIVHGLRCNTTPRSGAIFQVMYMSSIVYDHNFYKWTDALSKGDKNILTKEQQGELSSFGIHARDAFDITEK